MNAKATKIVSDAMALPAPVRAYVAKQLIDSLETDYEETVSPEWKQEIEKRCKEIDEGIVDLISSEDAFKNAFSSLI